MIDTLTGKQIGDLVDALLGAYPSRDDLRIMVRIELDETLEAIADGANQRVVTFNLVTWAVRSGRIDDLLAGARRGNPGNRALAALVAAWQAAAPATPAAQQPRATPSPAGPAAIDVFLSYAREDSGAMREVEASLRAAGLAVWTDEGLEAGTPSWSAAIEEAVAQAVAMVVLLSPAAKASVWVTREVALAQVHGKRIFPILVAGDERTAVLFHLIDAQWADGRQGLGPALQRVQPAVLRHLGREPASPIVFDWVEIPAGPFIMGSDKRKDDQARDNELPQHTVTLPAYRIARVPVTVAQFAAFVEATGYKTEAEQQGFAFVWAGHKWDEVKGVNWRHPRGPQSDVRQKQDHPVTCVTFRDAVAFCEWASKVTGMTVRLPGEAKWEKAARGTDGRIFPWGDDWPTKKHCNFGMNVGDTTPVGAYPTGRSPYGVLDMAGNVWERTSTKWVNKYENYRPDDRLEGGATRTVRGGSFYFYDRLVRCACRDFNDPPNGYVGFRVVSPGF